MPNVKVQMTNEKKYDLEERTADFGENIIDLAKALPRNPINDELISQIVRSGTSIGANYVEADGAESKRDFRHKIAICKKESKETKHWLRMIAKANPGRKGECKKLWSEAQELTLIFSSILSPKRTETVNDKTVAF
jgi:four helix bundle protein